MGESPDNSSGVFNPGRFRRAWRGLDPARRERLTQIVARGHPAQNPSDASLAAGIARRMKRRYAGLLFIVPPVIAGMMLGFAALSNRSPDPATHMPLGWSVAFMVLFVLPFEAMIFLAWIRARRAETVNSRIAQGNPAPDEPLAPLLRRLEQALVRVEQGFRIRDPSPWPVALPMLWSTNPKRESSPDNRHWGSLASATRARACGRL